MSLSDDGPFRDKEMKIYILPIHNKFMAIDVNGNMLGEVAVNAHTIHFHPSKDIYTYNLSFSCTQELITQFKEVQDKTKEFLVSL